MIFRFGYRTSRSWECAGELSGIWSTVWPFVLPRTDTYGFEVDDRRFAWPANKEAGIEVAVDTE